MLPRLNRFAVLAVINVFLFASCIASGQPYEPSTADQRYSVKWHPGNYILVPQEMSNERFLDVLEAISSFPGLLGIQKRYTWKSLEPEEGVYNFSDILSDLEACAETGKKLVIQIQAKSFRADAYYVPPYLLNPGFDGGIVEFHRGGYAPKLWNSNVLARLNSLYTALGKALDKHPALEAVTIPETALGKFKEPGRQIDRDGYLDALLISAQRLRESFPTTVVIQYINWPLKAVQEFSRRAVELSLGIGGPDTFPYASKLNAGVYQVYPDLAGLVPIGVAVQSDNYTAKFPRGPNDPTSIKEIYAFARDTLGANYIFWLYSKTPDDYFGKLVQLVGGGSQEDILHSGAGLSNTCPKVFLSCIK